MGYFESLKKSSVMHLMFAVTFFSSGLIINFFQSILYFGLKPFSKYYYRKLNYYLLYSFYSELVFMTEWWSDVNIILYVDKKEFEKYYGKEHGCCLMNHRYEVDWLIGWVFSDRCGFLGNSKAYAKKALRYIPIMGWAWVFAESLFLERNWDKDKESISNQIKELCDYPDTMWILLYAEGTRFTLEKLEACHKFSKEKGLPLMKHHLTPRTRGFVASLPRMRGKVGAIYDFQLAFDPKSPIKPTMTNLLRGEKMEAHAYVKRIPMTDIPEDEDDAAAWLHKKFEEKDRMMESFLQTGDFFTTSGVPRVDAWNAERRYYSLINTVFWAVVVLVPMFYYLIQLLISGATVAFSMAVGIIVLLYLLLKKIIGMSEISSSSSYGAAASAKKIE